MLRAMHLPQASWEPQKRADTVHPKKAREAHLKNHSKDSCGPCSGTTTSTTTSSTTSSTTTTSTSTSTSTTSTTTPMCIPLGGTCAADEPCCAGICTNPPGRCCRGVG